MKEKTNDKNETKKKSFFGRIFDKIDKKMEEKAKSQNSCCNPGNKGSSCCS